jgi:signal transduction histidine kinase
MSSEQSRPLRILVTDDERSILEAYRLILYSAQDSGARRPSLPMDEGSDDILTVMGWRYRLTLCTHAEDAVAAAHHAVTSGDPFAMAFFDVRMPPGQTGGLWAAEQMRAVDPQAAIVIVTGGSDVEARELVQRIPPPDRLFYIQKPFHPREVIQFVLALGARWEAERKLQRINEELEARVQERTRELASANAQLRTEMAERRRTQEALERERLEQMRLKDQFLSHVSHELRTPLAVIHQFVSILQDGIGGPLTDEQREYLEMTMRNVEQLRGMIGDLLDVTRAQTGRLRIAPERMSLAELIEDVLASLSIVVGQKDIALCADLPADLPDAHADPDRVRQVLINLIGNACKFTDPGGRITVAVANGAGPSDKGHMLVQVSDTGRGIPQDQLEHVFDQLYQVDADDAASRQGLGLGLYICRELVTQQGGRIWAESEPGRGSVFSFTVPRA